MGRDEGLVLWAGHVLLNTPSTLQTFHHTHNRPTNRVVPTTCASSYAANTKAGLVATEFYEGPQFAQVVSDYEFWCRKGTHTLEVPQ